MSRSILRPDDPARAHGGLEALYQERIIGGTGACVMTASDRAPDAQAIKRKPVLEISRQMPAAAQITAKWPATPCQAKENPRRVGRRGFNGPQTASSD